VVDRDTRERERQRERGRERERQKERERESERSEVGGERMGEMERKKDFEWSAHVCVNLRVEKGERGKEHKGI